MALGVDVSAGHLGLSYPQGNATSKFTLVIGTFDDALTISGLDEVPGVTITVGGNIDIDYTWTFVGQQTGGSLINDFEYWNCTFSMPKGFEGVPTLDLEIELQQ